MFGDHIRGRVFPMGRLRPNYRLYPKRPMVWGYEVVNTNTGKVLASDNTCSFTQMVKDCRDTTILCRTALGRGIKSKDLKA